MSKVSKQNKKTENKVADKTVKNNEAAKKEAVKREDHLLADKKVDLKKEPKNNADCNRMDRRFLYVKTGNYVVYARMLQLKRKEGYFLNEKDEIRCPGDTE